MMKATFYVTIIALAMFAFANNDVRAQQRYLPGAVVTAEGDTLNGLILSQGHQENTRSCKFRKSMHDAPQRLVPGQILSFEIFDHSFFELAPETVNQGLPLDANPPVFWEVLVDGTLSLYQYNDRIFVRKGDEPVTELVVTEQEVRRDELAGARVSETRLAQTGILTRNRYLGVLSAFTHDCPEVHQQLANVRLKPADMKAFVISYNQCVGADYTDFQAKRGVFSYTIGIGTGFTGSVTSLQRVGGVPSGNAFELVNPTSAGFSNFGLFLWVRSNRLFENLSLKTGILMHRTSYLINTSHTIRSFEHEELMLDMQLNYWIAPVQLNWEFPRRTVSHSVFFYYDFIVNTRGQTNGFFRERVYTVGGVEKQRDHYPITLLELTPKLKSRQGVGYGLSRRLPSGLDLFSEASLYHLRHFIFASEDVSGSYYQLKQTAFGLSLMAGLRF
jgi:hypothetical protein